MKIAVLGTNTDVGKTYIAKMMARELNALILKPVETGEGDAVKLRDEGFRALSIYSFKLPATPLLSAKMEGKRIEPDILIEKCREIVEREDNLIVEGVGGVASPIWHNFYSVDLAAELKLKAILVAKNGLGAITSTITAVRFAESRGVKIECVVLNMGCDGLIERTNAEIIRDEVGIEAICIGYGGDAASLLDFLTKY